MFSKLKVPELQKIAEDFGCDVQPNAKKADLLAAIEAEGVTWELYSMLNPPKEDETEPDEGEAPSKVKANAKPLASEKILLLKMQRANFSYEVEGYTFTREHPYVPVAESAANYILWTEEGLYLATPEEAALYSS